MKVSYQGDRAVISDFSVSEAYKISVRMETEGVFYYSSLRDYIKDPEIKEIFNYFAGEETKHLAFFKSKLSESGLEEIEKDSIVDHLDTKVFDFLKNVQAAGDVIGDNLGKALKTGILMEKQAISFYRALLVNVKNSSGADTILDIIMEEVGHLEKFIAVYMNHIATE